MKESERHKLFLHRFDDRPWLRRFVKVLIAIPIVIVSPFLQLGRAMKGIAVDPQTQGLILATIALLFTGSLIFHWLEDWSYVDSLYFSFITLATIGYGDFAPTTDLAKILTMIYVVAGLGIIFGFFDAIATQRLKGPGLVGRLRRTNEEQASGADEPPPAQS